MDKLPRDVMIIISKYYACMSPATMKTLAIIRWLIKITTPEHIDTPEIATKIMLDAISRKTSYKFKLFDKTLEFRGKQIIPSGVILPEHDTVRLYYMCDPGISHSVRSQNDSGRKNFADPGVAWFIEMWNETYFVKECIELNYCRAKILTTNGVFICDLGFKTHAIEIINGKIVVPDNHKFCDCNAE